MRPARFLARVDLAKLFGRPRVDIVQQKRTYPPVGRCIYCGTKEGDLTDEHIVPFALGGNMILPKASCIPCQRIINQEIETPTLNVLSGSYGPLRLGLNLPTRNKKNVQLT